MLVDPEHGRVLAADPVHRSAEVRPVGSKPSGDYEAARRHPGSPGLQDHSENRARDRRAQYACVLCISTVHTPLDGWTPFAGHRVNSTVTREGLVDRAWDSFEVETGGDLPCRSVTHSRPPGPYWEQDIPAVHLISWRCDDDEETRRALARLRPKMQLNITATAPQHALWMEHVVLLRVEIYYAQAQW